MEDVFYFTRELVILADIASLAEEAGFTPRFYWTGTPQETLKVGYGPLKPPEVSEIADDGTRHDSVKMMQDRLVWREWGDEGWGSLEPEDLARLEAYTPRSSFSISLWSTGVPELRFFMKKVLDRYGGWVGADEVWHRTYHAETIHTLVLAGYDE